MSLFTRWRSVTGPVSIGAIACATVLGLGVSLAQEDEGGGAVTSFRRGDANTDGKVNIADVISIIIHRLDAQTSPCMDAADADDDGSVNIADAIYIAFYVFRHGPAPLAPFPGCESDPTTTDTLDCGAYSACP